MSQVIDAPPQVRPTLGELTSVECIRSLVKSVEDIVGKRAAVVALRTAGRRHGAALIRDHHLSGHGPAEPSAACELLGYLLGAPGARLCNVDKVHKYGLSFRVAVSETVCGSGPPEPKPQLSFTFGVVQGALEELYGVRLQGNQVASPPRGQRRDVVEFMPQR